MNVTRNATHRDFRRLVRHLLPDRMRYRIRQTANALRSTEAVFTEIYDKGLWGGRDSLYSGEGSRGHAAERYVATVRQFIRANAIASVVDLGCGDFVIGSRIADVCDHYTGVDIVKRAVDENMRRHASERVRFLQRNIIEGALPDADLCLIRQVLQHLSNAQIQRILGKLAKYRFVIVTEHYPGAAEFKAPNLDKAHGAGTRVTRGSAVCLDQPPFNVRSLELLLDVPGSAAGEQPQGDDPHARGSIRTFLLHA